MLDPRVRSIYPGSARIAAAAALLLALAASGSAQQRKYYVHSFAKRHLTTEFYSEGASFGDFDRDGDGDIVSGPFWYEGPDFEKRHEIYPPKPFDPQVYSDNFFAWVRDFDGDGWNDVLFVGFPGKDASWYENPRGESGPWKRHQVFDVVDNESPTFVDLTGDGQPELVCQFEDRVGWAAPDWSDPAKPWTFHALSPTGYGARFTHGLGVGDVDGDGKQDVLWRHGWFEQPESLDGDPQWTFHPVPFSGRGGAQMFAYDIDGDGDNDVVSSQNAHGFGLYWFEQVRTDGKIAFQSHRIMGEEREDSPYGVVVGNLHAIDLVDMNDDGLRDIVTGSRYWAHSGRDEADNRPPYVYWFELVRGPAGVPPQFVPHRIDDDSGVGTQVVAGDVNGDGLPDVVVGNKKGTFVHLQARREVTRRQWQASQRRAIARSQQGLVAQDPGVVPVGRDGEKLNLDLETGDLSDWTATGTAFLGNPIRGDTVNPRRSDSQSQHAGTYWIGTYEPEQSDASTGTLTSAAFEVTRPFGSCLVGGGQAKETRVEIVRADSGEVIHTLVGRNRENMRRRYFDLRDHQGESIFVRLVDEDQGGWGHVNFDDLRLHTTVPQSANIADLLPVEQGQGYMPDEAPSKMTVPDGFRVELVAGEPDLHQPIALTTDARGRVWVAEAYSYPVRRPPEEAKDTILVFADEDGDGKFESRTVFIEGLNLVSGLEVGCGGVWVGAAPELLFIPDRDGDLKPDGEPEVLLDGWGYQDTHETLNAFNWGPDGWLYGCHGVFTHSRIGKPGTPDAERVPLNAGVWRYHPTRHEFEVFAWGASNQWGVDFDDHGQAFITACVIPHLYHVIQGGRYQRQAGQHFNPYVFDDIKTIADHVHYLGATPHAGNGVSGSVGGGHAHCGAMVYLGGTFPDEYRNAIFFNNIHGNRVNVDIPEPVGSGFVGRHGDDFLLANDAWFRGINLRYGPDGNVFLIDWYDEQACHLRQPEVWNRTNGRLYKVSYGDAAPRVVDVAAMSGRELVGLHLSENDWYVRQARLQLEERGAEPGVRAALVEMLANNPDQTRKLRALWSLHVIGGIDDGLTLGQLDSPHEYVRAWTIQLALEDREASREVLAKLARLAESDPSPVVRLYLAAALQRLPLADRWSIAQGLLGHGDDADDHNLPLMIWYGVEPLVPVDPARALSLAERAQIPTVARFIVRRIASEKDPRLDLILGTAASSTDSRQRAVLLGEVVEALKRRGAVAAPPVWRELFDRLESSADPAVRDQAMSLAVMFGDERARPLLRRALLDGDESVERREWALAALLRDRDPGLVPVLQGLLDDEQLRGRAIRGLAAFDDPRTPALLVARYGALEPAERIETVNTLTSRASFAKALLEAIADERIPSGVLDSATTRRQLASFGSGELTRIMSAVWGRSTPITDDKRAEIETYERKLTPDRLAGADLANGRAMFAKTCMACHTLFGVGGDIGPDITGSNRADVDYILTNILDPNAEVANEYMMAIVQTADGRYVQGVITDRNDETITIKNETETHIIRLTDVSVGADGKPSIMVSPFSMMPIGQHLAMSDDEIRDLVAYLGSPEQVPMRATADNVGAFFDGKTLNGWVADPAVWSVEDGEIVGRTTEGLARNDFARSELLLGDFRLVLEIRLVGDAGNSGIQLRSATLDDGLMKGYQADAGAGWWGKLYEEHGRGLLWDRPGDAHVRKGEWNTYEILAIGHRIRTAINGQPCVDLDDPDGALEGQVGLQVHSGGPTEVRFRRFELELSPEPRLKTVKKTVK